MINSRSKIFLIGLVGGIFGFFLTVIFFNLDYVISNKLPSNITNSVQITYTSVPLPTPVPDFWQSIVNDSSLGVVVVQVFLNNKLFIQGGGLILSSDGLIAVPAGLTVKGGIYQIYYDGKIYKGSVVKFDLFKSLALIKIDAIGLSVADLRHVNYNSGQDVVIISKRLDLSGSIAVVSQKGMVSYVTPKNIIIDTLTSGSIIGTGVINDNGDFIGLAYLRNGKVNMVKGASINDFFKTYSVKTK